MLAVGLPIVRLSESEINEFRADFCSGIIETYEALKNERCESINVEIADARRSIEESQRRIEESTLQLEELNEHISGLNSQNIALYNQRDELLQKKAAIMQKRESLLLELDAAKRLIAEGEAQQAKGKAQIALGLSQIAQGEAQRALGLAQKAQAEKLRAEAIEHGKEALRLKESAARRRETIAERRDVLVQRKDALAERKDALAERIKLAITTVFYGAFHSIPGKRTILSQENVDYLASKYLSDEQITVVKDPITKKDGPQINTTEPFAKYIQENPGITSCNLATFKEKIIDMKPLADCLAKPECSVTEIKVSDSLSIEARRLLLDAVDQRNGTLVIKTVSAPAVPASSS